jgi:hypothetical protein
MGKIAGFKNHALRNDPGDSDTLPVSTYGISIFKAEAVPKLFFSYPAKPNVSGQNERRITMSKIDYEAIWYELDHGDEMKLTRFLDDLDATENRAAQEFLNECIQGLLKKVGSRVALRLDEAINMLRRGARKHGIAAGRALSKVRLRDPRAVKELQVMRKKLDSIYRA